MKAKILFIILIVSFLVGCNSEKAVFSETVVVYQSENLVITKLTPTSYLHTSYLQTDDFGKVACNGWMVQSENEAVVFDTPTDEKSAEELLAWIKKNKPTTKVKAVIATHFHNDCVGGLPVFHAQKIPSFALSKTIELTKIKGVNVPKHSFRNELHMSVGNQKIVAKYFGEGHTSDNIVGYNAQEGVLFGGCLIKEKGAGKGNLEDANIKEWSGTLTKLQTEFKNIKMVIPGHGKIGDESLITYTQKLFNN